MNVKRILHTPSIVKYIILRLDADTLTPVENRMHFKGAFPFIGISIMFSHPVPSLWMDTLKRAF